VKTSKKRLLQRQRTNRHGLPMREAPPPSGPTPIELARALREGGPEAVLEANRGPHYGLDEQGRPAVLD
jgi:hypothetical protein